jgi:hypothetical protein
MEDQVQITAVPDKKPFSCPHCDFSSAKASGLGIHLRLTHGIPGKSQSTQYRLEQIGTRATRVLERKAEKAEAESPSENVTLEEAILTLRIKVDTMLEVIAMLEALQRRGK